MNTKTLLVAAATLAAGALASQAQVYSQNVVGYYNVSVPAGGYAIVANQLINGTDASATNENINAVLANGLVSDPNGSLNTILFYWNGAGYTQYQYWLASDIVGVYNSNPTATNGWYDYSGNYIQYPFNQGGGNFLENLTSSNITVTFVGTVPQGTNVLTVVPGFNMLSIVPPVSTNLSSSLVNFPGTSDPNGALNDVLFEWNGNGYYQYQYWNSNDIVGVYNSNPTATNGFYDYSGNFVNPAPPVGQAFFLEHFVGTTLAWTNSFVVQ